VGAAAEHMRNRRGTVELIDDHAHPFGLRARPLDLGSISLDVDPHGDERRRELAPGRLALEALRLRLARLLGCEPDDVEAVRDQLAGADWGGYVRRLFGDVGVGGMLLDGGTDPLQPDEAAAYADLAGAPTWSLLRIEAVIDPLIETGAGAAEICGGVERFVAAGAAAGAAGCKTVLAYRTGLGVDPGADTGAADRSLRELELPVRRRGKALRDLVLRRTLGLCADLGMPMQVHTGFGDSELRMADADPLLLDDLLRTPEGAAADVVLIHGAFPWHEQVAHLAGTRPHVWAEFSLANLISPATTADRLLRMVDLAPTHRLLLGSDGHGPPETHWFALAMLRDAWITLCDRLSGVVRPGWLADVERRIFADNARAVYRLDA